MPPPIRFSSEQQSNYSRLERVECVYAAQMIACRIVQPLLRKTEDGLLFAHATMYDGLQYRISRSGTTKKAYWGSDEESLYSASWQFISRYGVEKSLEFIESERIEDALERREADFIWVHRVVEFLLRINADLPKQASISRAQYMARHIQPKPRPIWGVDKIRKSWVKYRSVSHLIYACLELGIAPAELTRQSLVKQDRLPAETISDLVFLAKHCLQTLQALKPVGVSPKGIIEFSGAWSPDMMPGFVLQRLTQGRKGDKLIGSLPPLDEEERKTLAKYRSDARRDASLV